MALESIPGELAATALPRRSLVEVAVFEQQDDCHFARKQLPSKIKNLLNLVL